MTSINLDNPKLCANPENQADVGYKSVKLASYNKFSIRSYSSMANRSRLLSSMSSTRNCKHLREMSICVEIKDQIIQSRDKVRQRSIKSSNLKTRIIKQNVRKVLNDNSRDNKVKLSQNLQKLNKFFSKINETIALAIVLLGRIKIYKKGQTILQNKFNESWALKQKIQNQLPDVDIGFILCGKVELQNSKRLYNHKMYDDGTLNEHHYLGRHEKIEYSAKAMDQTIVLWIPKSSYFVIRKQCFLVLDLKYMFGEFENMLKLSLVQKRLFTQ